MKESSLYTFMSHILILYNIRSAHNVGSLFRTSDAAGISKIYLTGVTPAPEDKFKRPNKEIAKVALGAEKNIPWMYEEDIIEVLHALKKEGFTLIAIEQDERSKDYKEINVPERSAFILGEEVKGIPQSVLDTCDIIAEIPMKGKKESLNVSVAAGVALFRMLEI